MLLKLGKWKVWRCPTGNFVKRYKVHLITSPDRVNYSHRFDISSMKANPKHSAVPKPCYTNVIVKSYSSAEGALDRVTFESVCTETLESLTEYFEELVENKPQFRNGDVSYSDGVLTVHLGESYGTYVINRQTPNLQIWLSSPRSGPKRYDFVQGTWVYKHDQTTLHDLLDKELKILLECEVEFSKRCAYSKIKDS